MRRRSDLAGLFTFGGRVPATVGLFLSIVLVASVAAALNPALAAAAVLRPVAVERLQLWRLVTWVVVQPDPGTLVFGGFMLWWVGQQLSYAWSERRFALRVLGTTLFAGTATVLLGLVWPRASAVEHLGMWPLVNALVVAWAMLHPGAQVNVWGVLPVTGRTLALVVTGGTFLYAVYAGVAEFAPHLAALGLAWAQARGAGGGRGLRGARRWWEERAARRRARHLKVVGKNGSGGRSEWLN